MRNWQSAPAGREQQSLGYRRGAQTSQRAPEPVHWRIRQPSSNRKDPSRSPRIRKPLPTAMNLTRHPGLPQNWDSEILCIHSRLCSPATGRYSLLASLDIKLTKLSRATGAHSSPAAFQTSESVSTSAGSHCPDAITFLAEPQWLRHRSEAPFRPPGRGRYGNPVAASTEFTNRKCPSFGKRRSSPRSNSLLSWLPECRFSSLPQRAPPSPGLPPPSPKLPPLTLPNAERSTMAGDGGVKWGYCWDWRDEKDEEN